MTCRLYRLQTYSQERVQVCYQPEHARNTRNQYWANNGDLYVVVQNRAGLWDVDGVRCDLAVINAQGRVRGLIWPQDYNLRHRAAARHFDAVLYQSPYAKEA